MQYLKRKRTKIENKGNRAAGQEETAKKGVEVARSPSAATSNLSTLLYTLGNEISFFVQQIQLGILGCMMLNCENCLPHTNSTVFMVYLL